MSLWSVQYDKECDFQINMQITLFKIIVHKYNDSTIYFYSYILFYAVHRNQNTKARIVILSTDTGKNSKTAFIVLILSLSFEIFRKTSVLADEYINTCGKSLS